MIVGEVWREIRQATKRTDFDYSGKVFVITGGAGGIGSTLARAVARRGALVVIVDRDEDRLGTVLAELLAISPDHISVAADLTLPDDIRTVLRHVQRRFQRIDVLVNNAGMTSSERFADRSLDSISYEFAVNTISPLHMTRLALDLLRRSKDPRVVNTVSLAGIWPQAETSIYCASKFGLRGAMLSIALDLRDQGIQVGSVLPSATDTRGLQKEAIEGGNALQFQDPPQSPHTVVASMMSLLDRPRLEVYPKPRESRLVRSVMNFPNIIFILMPFFAGRGEKGMRDYIDVLRARGDVVEVDGKLELAP